MDIEHDEAPASHIKALLEKGPEHWNLDDLKCALQAAVDLELATLPPYLTALWSIRSGYDEATRLLTSVIKEEMLHMVLAGNMLTTIGGTVRISAPVYPGTLPGDVMPDLDVPLGKLTRELVGETFMRIEHPAGDTFSKGEWRNRVADPTWDGTGTPGDTSAACDSDGRDVAEATASYATIGKFYDAIATAFECLQPALTGERQLTGTVGGLSFGPITTMHDVRDAIEEIKEQGEGTTLENPITDPKFGPPELAHFYRFGEIFHGKMYVNRNADDPDEPAEWAYAGADVPFPTQVYDMADVPSGGYPQWPQHTAEMQRPDYRSEVDELNREFDTAFTKVIEDLDAAWGPAGGPPKLGAAIEGMYGLKIPARALMEIPLPPEHSGNYGPTWTRVPEAAALDDIVSIAVYPGIGIARVGNSDTYFIGPEAPGHVPSPGDGDGDGDHGTYKVGVDAMKPQAARFRVYGFDAAGDVVAELTADNATVDWTVHVRNMKAANYAFRGRYLFDPDLLRNDNIQGTDSDGNVSRPVDRDKLIIDPGPKTISGRDAPAVPLDGGSIYKDVDPSGLGLSLPKDLPFSSQPRVDPNDPDRVLVRYRGADVDLGRLQTDDHGRLVFVPGAGKSESCTDPQVCIHQGGATTDPITGQYSYFNVPGWYDDTCGGSIDAVVSFATSSGDKTLSTGGDPLRRGWVSVAPPKYSPWTYNMVSLLDLQINLFPGEDPAGDQTDPTNTEQVNFYRDIYPTLATATHYGWTSQMASRAHGPYDRPGDFLTPDLLEKLSDPTCEYGDALRRQIWAILRHGEPDNVPPPPRPAPVPVEVARKPQESFRMPKLWGSGGEPVQNDRLSINAPNQFLSLTTQQLARFEKWSNGDFVTGEKIVPVSIEETPLQLQPRALNFAALQPTVGGGFHPGIEITYISTFPEWFAGPFRVAGEVEGLTIEPGQVNGFMALPWQGDFWSCNTMWWPAQRPEVVVDVDDEGRRTLQDWFRGKGIPEGASTVPGYAEGYNIMVHIWPKLGIIARTSDRVDGRRVWALEGEEIFEERERDDSLDESLDIPPGSCVPPGYNGDTSSA